MVIDSLVVVSVIRRLCACFVRVSKAKRFSTLNTSIASNLNIFYDFLPWIFCCFLFRFFFARIGRCAIWFVLLNSFDEWFWKTIKLCIFDFNEQENEDKEEERFERVFHSLPMQFMQMKLVMTTMEHFAGIYSKFNEEATESGKRRMGCASVGDTFQAWHSN